MQSIDTDLDLEVLLEEVNRLKTWLDGSGALMAVTQSGGIPDKVRELPATMAAILQISRARGQPPLNVMVNTLAPGVGVPKHVDRLRDTTHQRGWPRVERWHLPILTNELCSWWDAVNGTVRMLAGGWWGPVPYWVEHSVQNLGDCDRVHLVVDLDTEVPCG